MSTQSGFDISAAKPVADIEDAGQIVHARDAAGEPMYYGGTVVDGKTVGEKPVTLTVAGTYSKTFRRAQDAQRNRNVKAKRASLTGDALLRQQLELTAACILSWDGFFNAGAVFECTLDNKIALLEAAPWIREQVEEAMSDHAGFSTKRSEN